MLKRFVFILFAVLLLATSAFASITMNLTADPAGDPTVNFGAMNGGDWKELYAGSSAPNCHILRVISDTNTQWNVQISSAQLLTHTSLTAVTIPQNYFLWMSTFAGHWDPGSSSWWDLSSSLSYPPAGGYNQFYTSGTTVYTSGLVAGKNDNQNNNDVNGTQLGFKFGLAIPAEQTAGSYGTTIVYTLTQ